MVSLHLRTRFLEHAGRDLTPILLGDLVRLASTMPLGRRDPIWGDREHLRLTWEGLSILMVWCREKRFVYTFLSPFGQDFSLPR